MEKAKEALVNQKSAGSIASAQAELATMAAQIAAIRKLKQRAQ
jgi:hypothetical protein